MFIHLDNQLRFKMRHCDTTSTIILLVLCVLLLLSICSINVDRKVYIVQIDANKRTRTVPNNFLSIALDSSIIANNMTNFDTTNPKLIKLMKALAPAYLRIGGTMADRLIFSPHSQQSIFKPTFKILDGDLCFSSYDHACVFFRNLPNFTMTGQQWLELNLLAERTGLEIVFDLNALLRFENGTWDYRNAELLLEFSQKNNLKLHFELGNEPNSFRHHFNYEVKPEQLANDFNTLHNLLKNRFPNALLVGPDVTRPRLDNNDSENFLFHFLVNKPPIDAVTFHQYYFDGRLAKPTDFVDPLKFDILKWQIVDVRTMVQKSEIRKPIWLGETSSAYGGGAPNLSNRYIATFIWLDKLGVAAKYGVDVVVRQTIFGGNYALLNKEFNPLPDWWISVIYKKLVGRKVVSCYVSPFLKVRFYCHCAKTPKKIIVFGMNLSKKHTRIRIEGQMELFNLQTEDAKVDAYVITSSALSSNEVFLNGIKLVLQNNTELPDIKPIVVSAYPHLSLPPYSIVFWVISTDLEFLC